MNLVRRASNVGTVNRNGTALAGWQAHVLRRGAELEIGVPGRGRFGYLCLRGGVDVPPVLGSRSTYLRGGFGGLEGRMLRAGDRLPMGSPAVPLPETPGARARPLPRDRDRPIRVLAGPQFAMFADDAVRALEAGAFTLSASSDRMGYRLEGPPLGHAGPAEFPSEPVCPGAIQVPQGSAPIVLMADGPTVGGYPKIAVVRSVDLGILAQCVPGSAVRFTLDHRGDGS